MKNESEVQLVQLGKLHVLDDIQEDCIYLFRLNNIASLSHSLPELFWREHGERVATGAGSLFQSLQSDIQSHCQHNDNTAC